MLIHKKTRRLTDRIVVEATESENDEEGKEAIGRITSVRAHLKTIPKETLKKGLGIVSLSDAMELRSHGFNYDHYSYSSQAPSSPIGRRLTIASRFMRESIRNLSTLSAGSGAEELPERSVSPTGSIWLRRKTVSDVPPEVAPTSPTVPR